MRTLDVLHIADPAPWKADGSCGQIGPADAVFFPGKSGSTQAAKRVCSRCPVKEQCLQYAIDNDIREGVWGGTTEQERAKLEHGYRHECGWCARRFVSVGALVAHQRQAHPEAGAA